MTAVIPIGTHPFWLNVYPGDYPFRSLGHPHRRGAIVSQADDCLYRLKVTPWIPHDGETCPCEEWDMVRVRLRSGRVLWPKPAWLIIWENCRLSEHSHVMAWQLWDNEKSS